MNDLERDLLAMKGKMTILSSNKVVCRLLAAVVYDQSNETFLLSDTQVKVSKEIVAIENDFNKCKTLGKQLFCNHCTGSVTPLHHIYY